MPGRRDDERMARLKDLMQRAEDPDALQELAELLGQNDPWTPAMARRYG